MGALHGVMILVWIGAVVSSGAFGLSSGVSEQLLYDSVLPTEYVHREPDCGCVEDTQRTACLEALQLYAARNQGERCILRESDHCRNVQWNHRCVGLGETPTKRCSVFSHYGFARVNESRLSMYHNRVSCALRKHTVVEPINYPRSLPLTEEVFPETIASQCRKACPTCSCLNWTQASPDMMEKFVDDLPLLQFQPPNFRFLAKKGQRYVDLYIRSMQVTHQKFHRDLDPTVIFSFGDTLFGGGILARSRRMIFVDWINRLPNNHILPVDESIIHHRRAVPEVQTVVHVHGAHTATSSDGWPLGCRANVPGANSDVFRYPNDQGPMLSLFHDHCEGTNRLNFQAGLVSPFFLREEWMERALPRGDYHVPLIFKDFDFYANGYMAYPDQGEEEEQEGEESTEKEAKNAKKVQPNRPSVIPEYFGQFLTVNGRAWPRFEVKRAVYRFSVINACNSRFLVLQLVRSMQGRYNGPPPMMTVVGADHGLLDAPHHTRQLILGPLERATILIDFSQEEGGETIEMRNAALDDPFSVVEESVVDCESSKNCERPTGMLMRFDVLSIRGLKYSVPTSLSWTPKNPVAEMASLSRTLTLGEGKDDTGRLLLLINNRTWSPNASDDLKPHFGASETWCFKNPTPDTHPMHIHLISFRVLKRINFKTGEEFGPDQDERGFKDTVRVYPGGTTCVQTLPFDIRGKFVVHCHIMEHSNFNMIQTFEVV